MLAYENVFEKRANKVIVDLHAHALTEQFLDEMARRPISGFKGERLGPGKYSLGRAGDERKNTIDPHLFDLEARIRSLRERKVVKQLVGPPPNLVSWPGGGASVEHVRAIHKMLKSVEDESQGLIEATGAASLGEPEKAADELQRAVDEYGFRQLILPSSAGGRPLDEPAFAPFFAKAEKLGVVLFMHPVASGPWTRFDHWGVGTLIGFPFETTLSITRMIFTGLLERHPALKILLAHGGGNLVFMRGRLDSAYHATGWEADPYFRKNISRPPSEYLHRLYYDTCALSEESNRFVIDTMGPDHVVFGSDFPFDIGDPEGRRSVPVIDSLPQADRDQVYSGTAIGLLGGLNKH
jgi:aminocarboxymuconate-semialdehyde decarboxylase